MSDSPAVRVPLDPQEQPILDQLLSIRTQLELMKQDKSCFVKTDDVMRLYQETLAQVHILNNIRTNKRHEQNRVDTVLDDCFQLLSLAFMTIGKNHEAPAMYSVVSTIKRLLDHLREAAFYSPKDLEMASQQLQNFRDTIERGKEDQDPHLVTLLEARIDICQNIIAELQHNLSGLTPELLPVYEQLVSILRSLSACNLRSTFPKEEVEDLREQLRQIQKKLDKPDVVGSLEALVEQYAEKMREIADNAAPDSQQIVHDLLTRCLLWSELIETRFVTWLAFV
jgi:chromosome segregation ATPase